MSSDVQDRAAAPAHDDAPGVPGRVAALTGLLAVAAALGVSHLVAGLVDPPSSPYLAVGSSFIDLTPSWLKDFAVEQFGTADKAVLLGGMAVVLALLGALVGLLARRDVRLGLAGIGLLGVVGALAVLNRPDTATIGLLAPLAAVAAGGGALVWMQRAASASWPRVRPRTPRGTLLPVSRRTFLGTSAAVAAGAGVGALAGQSAGGRADVAASQTAVGTIAPVRTLAPLPAGTDFLADGGLPFITANADFYRIDTALSPPRVSAADWSLRIHGMVDREITLTFDDLRARELIAARTTIACVSYDLGSDLVGTAEWVGVSLRDILLEAGVQPGADQIFSTSVDGFTASTPVETVMEPDRGAMLALNMNGEPLPVEHGFPVRMLVPGLYGFVSATKWITDIELTTYAAKLAYWTPKGWSDRGPIKTTSKIVSATAGAASITVTGAAWAPHTGIAAVEVRLDDQDWEPARLAADAGRDTWRMFRADLTDVAPGPHLVQCRAVDADGVPQIEERAMPAPDGATGLHTVRTEV